ncbi:MAG: hypothetical protein ACRDWD_07895 [Acidimicrobiia bacterium]
MSATDATTTSTLWGIGSYRVGDDLVTFPVSEDDLQRDILTAQKNLSSLGVERGKRALVTSMLAEGAQYWPVQIGLLMAGTQMSCADASRSDAFRTRMFLNGPTYDVAVGISGDVLDGLLDLDASLGELFGRVPVVAARSDAIGRLRDAGVEARLWLHVGPTIAVECDTGGGAHVDGEEWRVESDGGEVRVSARNVRAARIDGVPTGVRAEIVGEPCGCGRADVRLVPTP